MKTKTNNNKTLQTRLLFKHDKQYTNKWNITLPLLIVINIQEQQNQWKYFERARELELELENFIFQGL